MSAMPPGVPVRLDHVEVHIDDSTTYCAFLERLFQGGRSRSLDDRGTRLFVAPGGERFEIKVREPGAKPARSGVCMPCLRTPEPRVFVSRLGLPVDFIGDSPEGEVVFFTDPQGVQWHVKERGAEIDPAPEG
ncbi:MAG TPA: hypothetical protein VK858_11350 [Longimicrobiales bacterium]|nr:hypothetical protein [Longimicrobiales bacterium]